MKTLASILCSLSFVFATAAFGNDSKSANKCQTISPLTEASSNGLQTNVFQNATGRVSVVLIQEEAQPVQITVSDSDHNTLFKERVTETAAKQNFDLRQLEKGNYIFTINANGNCFVKIVEVK